jgi:hypothetical protein
MTRGKWHSPWCSLFESLLDERDLGVTEFAKMTGDVHNNISSYKSGSIKPPLEKLELFADKLDLDESQRKHFLKLGHLAHTPSATLDELKSLREMLKDLKEEAQRNEARTARLAAHIAALEAQLRKHGISPVER